MTGQPSEQYDELEQVVIALIAETFDAPPGTISRATTADDVAGWDSLGHSVLMTRLARRLATPLGEDVAASSHDVGALIAALRTRSRCRVAGA